MACFLETIAHSYKERYPDLSRLTFVMPNKRSGSFLLRAFAGLCSSPSLAPAIMPVTDFVAAIASAVEDSRTDLIIRLYKCYLALQPSSADISFEKFSSWGETLLSDFNEVDMQLVDPDEIFKNVYDLNAIRSNFLSPEQRKVMVEYFDYSPELLEEEFDTLWRPSSDGGGEEGIRQKFQTIWKLLNPLYKSFSENLAADGLTTSGGLFREVAEKITQGNEPFPGQKIVFVGFNALSEAESKIFRGIKNMEIPALFNGVRSGETEAKADFIWDLAPAVFAANDEPAMKFVSVNIRKENFPPPDWLTDRLRATIPARPPEIKVVAVPSNVVQAKVAGAELASLMKYHNEMADARIAVVLPDENLLLPVLYSLPHGIEKLNLTMGFPLRQTPVIGFASLLRRLHYGGVASGKDVLFRFEDVKDFLGHPYCSVLFERNEIEKFLLAYAEERRIMVHERSLRVLGPHASSVFRLFDPESTKAPVVIDYILDILRLIRTAMEEKPSDGFLRSGVEKIYIGTYADALIRLRHCLEEHEVALSPREVFMIADRFIAAENVAFDGKPLEGLQIMGVLETRCLDFDRIIMLSVNDKMMPRIGRNSTFIPNSVRAAFGMPPANYQEELFAYYFFRVLGRCRQAVLTYDSRSSENRTPGPSRYILQLKYLHPEVTMHEVEARFSLPERLQGDIEIPKEGEICSRLERYLLPKYRSGGSAVEPQKHFSASALGHYFKCPVQFLYGDVMEIYTEREKMETIDAIDMGTIVHSIIERLYFPEGHRGHLLASPITVDADFIRGLLDERAARGGETRIERESREAILRVHFGKTDEEDLSGQTLRGSAALIFENIQTYVRKILLADLQQTPFRLWGSEIKHTVGFPLPDGSGRKVSMKMVIDRLDQQGAQGTENPFRIVDYKTGGVHLSADNLDGLFSGEWSSQNIFQLFLYAELLLMLLDSSNFKVPVGIDPEALRRGLTVVIYHIPQLPTENGIRYAEIGTIPGPRGGVKGRPVKTVAELREIEAEEGSTVTGRLGEIISGILDFGKPFASTPEESRCRMCDFRLRCEVMRARRENNR